MNLCFADVASPASRRQRWMRWSAFAKHTDNFNKGTRTLQRRDAVTGRSEVTSILLNRQGPGIQAKEAYASTSLGHQGPDTWLSKYAPVRPFLGDMNT